MQYIYSDCYVKFVPTVSNWIESKNKKETRNIFDLLSDKGRMMMLLDNYGFSKKSGFVKDEFGISG